NCRVPKPDQFTTTRGHYSTSELTFQHSHSHTHTHTHSHTHTLSHTLSHTQTHKRTHRHRHTPHTLHESLSLGDRQSCSSLHRMLTAELHTHGFCLLLSSSSLQTVGGRLLST